MNREPRTQPLPTEILPRSAPLAATEAPIAETLPGGPDFARVLGLTEPLQSAATEEAKAEDAAESLSRTQPQPVHDSEPLRQLDKLAALVEQELRKSNPPPRAAVAAAPVVAGSEEESLQNYLDRFMERVTGRKPDPIEPPAPVAAPGPFAPPAAAQPEQVSTAPSEPLQPREPAKAPECRETLTAMRHLANENARTAVAAHAGRSLWRRTKLTLVAASAASVVSSLAAAWHLASATPGALECAVLSGGLAALMSCRFFLRCREFRVTAPTA